VNAETLPAAQVSKENWARLIRVAIAIFNRQLGANDRRKMSLASEPPPRKFFGGTRKNKTGDAGDLPFGGGAEKISLGDPAPGR
jgi:hypothetical protein